MIENAETAVLDSLRDAGWRIEESRSAADAGVDVVARDAAGHVLLGEFKLGRGRTHVGAVAQLASFLDAYERSVGTSPVGVLFTSEEPDAAVRAAADQVGVTVIPVASRGRRLAPEVLEAVQAAIRAVEAKSGSQQERVVSALGAGRPAAGFWSYVRADDFADGGRIRRLAQAIQNEYALLTGDQIEVFIDREDIAWGDEWRTRIDEALAGTAFFIPVITPRYFASSECRRELLTFAGHAESLGVFELLLPLLYVAVQDLHPQVEDEAMRLVARTQYFDWTALRLADEASSEYRQGVHQLASRIFEINRAVAERPAVRALDSGDENDQSPPLLETMAEAEEALPRWQETIETFPRALEAITEATVAATSRLERSDARGKGFAGRLAIARELARELQDPAAEIRDLGSRYASDLAAVDAGVLTIIRRVEEEGVGEIERQHALELFESLRSFADISHETVKTITDFAGTLEDVSGLSRELRTPFRMIRDGLQRVIDGQAIIDEWVRRIDQIDLAETRSTSGA